MSNLGFFAGGPGEHQHAYEQHIAELRKRLEDCSPEERPQVESEISDAEKELKKATDGRILW